MMDWAETKLGNKHCVDIKILIKDSEKIEIT